MDHAVGPGKLIGGRYELTEPIGSGGFGKVWKARDQRLQTDVAVKGLLLPLSASPTEREERLKRAEREVLNAARLRDHPNIVSVHDVVVEDEIPWMVMQLVVGRALNARVRESGPLSVREATDVARALLKALDAAHRAGIVHRDIKPANVMLADNGEILLTDFGIATHDTDVSLTVTGSVVGSAPYMAPERVHGEKGQAPSDLFSLGVTLHEAVEGASPFDRDSTPASLHAVAYEDPPSPQRAGTLTPLITRLLAKAPEDRPTVAEALALLDSPMPDVTPSEVTSPHAAAPPTAVVTETSLTPPEAMRTATALPPPPVIPLPPVAPVGGTPAPASSGGSVQKWLGWLVALALGVLVAVLVTVNQGEDSETGTGSSAGGAFSSTGPVSIGDLEEVESRIDVVGVEGNAPGSLGVSVDVTHSHIGDLEVELVSPDGTVFELEAFEGPHEYSVDASAVGASGTWTLRIDDTAAVDEGTLNSWSLSFGTSSVGQQGSSGGGLFSSSGSVSIVDNEMAESRIDVVGVEGNAPGSLGVSVDVTHSYIGDLEVELVSPDGTVFELEAFEGPHEYSVDASAVGASGTWTLRIDDTAAADEGTLNSWSLRF
ncbi:protein kinase domain-containing protein [Streptomyces johnsoniae]|uniref:non-specific serine/threonine protein kinase n=1 Tax=Streptomyces johnsoniae TaxID=3075532 RepID=A0ABU2S4Q2_9ACTN|nr:proprotein convertase P-domain-containing protein [Streptomyces sp. DSM 41886]MDT0443045.1 proprotein convertase P-domain-containing protein [Streptomyces sp. DSM 41886]